MKAMSIVGTWRLVSCELSTSDGKTNYPYGRTPTGHILYSRDGFMSVTIMSPDRSLFASNDILDGSSEEKLAAVETYLSYSGRYDIRRDRVIHRIEVSLFPNWVGTTQERRVTLGDDTLTLTTDPFVAQGQSQVACLVWKRVSTA